MSKTKTKITIEEILSKSRDYIEDEKQIALIEKAYQFASQKHKGQIRKSGDPYISHPMNVAWILLSIYADYETIIAGFLHDVMVDADCTYEEIEEAFGENIAKLVNGVTKLSKIHFSTENEYLIDYYKKIIVGMSEDVRVIIVKLADCLHNMKTLWAIPEDRQKDKAHEALDIMAPLAHHLGIHKIKSELEDLALRYLKPDVFYDIAEKLNKTKLERDKTVYDMQNAVSDLLNEHHIVHEIKGRAKSIYSIYNKLDKGKKFSDIYDLLALRILVNTEQECYLALGLIHSKFRPLPKRFKDYIAMPKPNMYQSLHTTVFGIDGYLFEIQIRTYEMDEVAENGIASHWAYKENGGSKDIASFQTSTEQKLQFFKSIIDLSQEKLSSEEFVESVEEEVLNHNSIYCYTPKGDVIELPKGATPLDFAYKIHTKIGETTVGAIVNDTIVPLNYELQDGDIVKINTNKNSTPSKEWINMVKSSTIKNKIKAFFSKNDREIYVERGKYALEKDLRKRKIPFAEFMSDGNIKTICENLKLVDLEDIYFNIGNNKLTSNGVINIIEKEEKTPTKVEKDLPKSKDIDVIVSGIDNVKVSLANCCNPVYGDEIIGYITKGNGITVHRMNCHNLEMLEDRTVDVSWNEKAKKKYLTCILIHMNDEKNHMLDILQTISSMNISVDGISALNKGKNQVYELTYYVTSLEQLQKCMFAIEKNSFVEKVERAIR